jgi:cAMP-dependent protein kinase regulator
LDRYERARVADVLREMSFKDGDYVISQGERGDMFYIIVEVRISPASR